MPRYTPPPSDGLPFKPDKFVVGGGPMPSACFLAGRNPGQMENSIGKTFIGPAGNELSMYLLRADLQRADMYLSNLYKFYTLDDAPPAPEQLDAHWAVFCRELALVRPRVLVTFGGEVTEYFFKRCGLPYRGLECHHGIPVNATLPIQDGLSAELDNIEYLHDNAGIDWLMDLDSRAPATHAPLRLILFPNIHPAAGLHQVAQMGLIYKDFLALADCLNGKLKPRDPLSANPAMTKRALDDPDSVWDVFNSSTSKWMGLDTEGLAPRPWGLTFSLEPFIGYRILAKHRAAIEAFRDGLMQFIANGGTLIIHNVLHDLDVLRAMGIDLPEGSYVDSMVVAYLLGREPQGLKPLSYRYLDFKMRAYEDVVGPYDRKYGIMYLEAAAAVDWDECPKCGAFAAANTEHPKGGVEKLPPEWLRKDGKTVRKKFADQVQDCDGGLAETMEITFDKNGNPRRKRIMPIGKRIARALKDYTETSPKEASGDDDNSAAYGNG